MTFEREFTALSFHIVDYVILASMFLISLTIGLYYAIRARKNTSAKEYFNAGGNIGVLPATLSLFASILCSIWYVGMPTEVYYYGFYFLFDLPAIVICLTIASFAFAPVFYELNVTSASEYLEKRFNSTIRILSSTLYLLNSAFYIALVMFIPAMAISQVIGIHLWISISSMCLVGTLYTALGGIRAVMWTDVFQTFIIYASMIFVAIKGTIDIGGLSTVWEKGVQGNRIAIAPISVDPRYRYTLFAIPINCLCYWLGFYGTYQTQIQRYLSCPSIRSAQKAIWINIPALIIVEIIIIYIGLVVYAHYADCDPLLNNEISSSDELLTYFVMSAFKKFPGMAGLFVAGIFSGALSTISSCLNSMTAVTIEDFVTAVPRFKNIADQTRTSISKWIVVIYGCVTMMLMLIVERLDSIITVWAYNNGAIFGCNMGLFVLGMFCPWVNAVGALSAFVASVTFGLIFAFGAQFSGVTYEPAPLSVENCPVNNFTSLLNNTTLTSSNTTSLYAHDLANNDGINEFFKMSPFLVQPVTFFISVVVGMTVSKLYVCGRPKPVDIKLFSPVIQKWVKNYWKFDDDNKSLHVQNLDQLNCNSKEDKTICSEHESFLPALDIKIMYKTHELDIKNEIV